MAVCDYRHGAGALATLAVPLLLNEPIALKDYAKLNPGRDQRRGQNPRLIVLFVGKPVPGEHQLFGQCTNREFPSESFCGGMAGKPGGQFFAFLSSQRSFESFGDLRVGLHQSAYDLASAFFRA